MLSIEWSQDFMRDLRHGLRLLRAYPGFSAICIAALALGIGASTAMFSILDAVLLRPLPYADPERIVLIGRLPPPAVGLGSNLIPWGETELNRFSSQATQFDAIAGFESVFLDLTHGSASRRVDGIKTSAGLFAVLGVAPALGRTFTPAEDVPGHDHFVVLSDALWRQEFAADPAIVGRGVTIDGESFVVLGVMPPGFAFPLGAEMPANFQFPARPALWIPSGLPAVPRRGPATLTVVGKLRADSSREAAAADLAAIGDRLVRENAAYKAWVNATLIPMREQSAGQSRQTLAILMGAVALLLLVACANVSTLMLARLSHRAHELTIRAAIGASRGRLMRQLLTEGLLLAGIGALVGGLLAQAAVEAIIALAADRLPHVGEAHVDATVLLFALILTVAVALLCSLLPARQGGLRAAESLRSGGRVSPGLRQGRVQNLLVIAEVTLSIVLLVGAGLLVRTFMNLTRVDPGFGTSRALTFELTLPKVVYPDYASRRAVYHRLLAALGEAPGISSAALGNLPLTQAQEQTVYVVEGQPREPDSQSPIAEYVVVSPDYFEAMGIPLRAGRAFRDADTETSGRAVVVSETMARRLWPGQEAIGQRLRLPIDKDWSTVIGVVPDLRLYSLRDEPRLEMFVSYQQRPYPPMQTMQFVVRTAADARAAASVIRAAVASVDPTLPVAKLQPMAAIVDESLTPVRFSTLLLASFAGLALLLAATGLYGVLSHHVASQTREIGVRLAIGASPARVLGEVLRQGAGLVATGAIAGSVAALLLARAMRSLLFGVTDTDPLIYAIAAVLLAAVATIACLVPARRAMKVDPLIAMRAE